MPEYIEREAAKKILSFGVGVSAALALDKVPAADVVAVVHGRWIVTEEYNDVIEMDVVKYTCSACGEYRLSATGLSQATNYCPNCGAKMDGGDAE